MSLIFNNKMQTDPIDPDLCLDELSIIMLNRPVNEEIGNFDVPLCDKWCRRLILYSTSCLTRFRIGDEQKPALIFKYKFEK